MRADATVQLPSIETRPEPWRAVLARSIRDPSELLRELELPERLLDGAVAAARGFGVFAPPGYVARMRRGDPHDPLLRQVLPVAEELAERPGFVPDPVGDALARRAPGLLSKYRGRALLLVSGACAVHCRYCFRRHYPYEGLPRGAAEWEPALAALAADPGIEEAILSGGDPLTLPDAPLSELAQRLAAIPHLARLRVHTRLPIVIPERVTPALVAWLRGTRLAPLVVVHANHAAELDGAVGAALGRLVDAGVPVLNQTVLLRGVNDSVEALEALCRRLVDLRVLPYYLHQLDRVVGAAHFEVPVEQGLAIVRALGERLPGYAVPRYVREAPGLPCKELLA